MQSQFSGRAAVVKIFDGKSWSIRGLIKDNEEWDGFIHEIRSQKAYYSQGFCCYNEKFINGIEVEGGDEGIRYVINDATPNGKSQIFQMYWRPNKFREIQNEPGYSQAASKKISMKMNRFINDVQKMEFLTERSLDGCAGKYSIIPGDYCTTKYELQQSKSFNAKDSSKYTVITNYHVFLNRNNTKRPLGSWETILDTGGYIFAMPTLAIQEFDKTIGAGAVVNHYKPHKEYDLNRNISLVYWGLKRYECSIFDKKSRKQKFAIPLEAIFNRCGDLCDSYQENIIINDSIRILIFGYDK